MRNIGNIIADLAAAKSATAGTSSTGSSTASINKTQIEYVIGIDLGHGETSASYLQLHWDKPLSQLPESKGKDINLGNGEVKVIPTAIAITNNDKVRIGETALEAQLANGRVYVCFKQRPTDIMGEKEQLMIKYMREVYHRIREVVGADLTDTNHLVYIACPSGWDKSAQKLYMDMAIKAGLPMGGIIKESKAAYFEAKDDPDCSITKNMGKGVVVVDMGSSTLDFTYIAPESQNPQDTIDNGYDCGASAIEKALFTKCEEENGDGIRKLRETYPQLVDRLLFEFRKSKEAYYRTDCIKFNVKQDLSDLTGDDSLDGKVKFNLSEGGVEPILINIGYIGSICEALDDFKQNYIPNKPIYGVLLTGGASRMPFIEDLIKRCWGIEKIHKDQDPSLTISRGVAVAARKDLRTEVASEDLNPLFLQVKGSAVYDKFVEIFGNHIYESVAEKVSNECIEWRDANNELSLNSLNNRIKKGVKKTAADCSSRVEEAIQLAINEETKDLREKVDAIVAVYTAQGLKVSLPSFSNLEVMKEGTDFDMSGVITEISSAIETDSDNWGGLIAGAGIGAAVAMIFGGPLAWIIGSGALLGKLLFGKEETEEQKRKKAMAKGLSSDERVAVCNALGDKWDEITKSIYQSVFKSLQNNSKVRKSVVTSVDKLMKAYKEALKKSRIMVD